MNIHFSSFFSSEYDLDIMPFWIEHYLKFQFDSYHVFLHRESGKPGDNIINQFKHHGFSVDCVDGPYGHGIAQKLYQGVYADSLPPEDFLCIADADEFQSGPGAGPFKAGEDLFIGPPVPEFIHYRELLKHVDIVTGFMVDRFTHRLETCFCNPFRQYPYEEPFTKEILKNFTPPQYRRTEWPLTRRTKVLVARAKYEVAYEGNHCLIQVPEKAQVATDYKVYHFAWRESAKKKTLLKVYYTQENCKEVFGNDVSQDILDNRMTPENLFKGTVEDARFVPENVFQP